MMEKIKKITDSIVFILPITFIYVISNFFIILLLYLYAGGLWQEAVKWFQLFCIIIIITYFLKKLNRYLAFTTVYFINFFYLVLIGYFIVTSTKLDFSFLKRNAADIGNIMPQIISYLIIVIILALINSIFIYNLKFIFENKYKKIIFFVLGACIIVTMLPKHNLLDNELVVFAKTVYKNDETLSYYQGFYNDQIKRSVTNRTLIEEQAKNINKDKLPYYLDNIIIFHLESLNGFLVNEKNTPVLTRIGQENIFFPKLSSNSVQTMLGYETMLCSMSSSFDMNLVNNENIKNMLCLPNFLKNLGYKNYFFKGGIKLSSTRTDEFIPNIGFDEMHNNDITQPGDPKYPWGYREDIFYKRVFQYLNKNLAPKKNFLYIDVGATNHWPFNTPPGYEDVLPYPNPQNHQQRLTNTIFLQDHYLQIAWDELNKLFPQKNFTLFILGDHSWPAEIHKGNTFNQKGAYEENFTDAMAMVVGREYDNKKITNRYSQMDILPSVIDLFGLQYPKDAWRKSFINELTGGELKTSKIIEVQPYSEKDINIIDGTNKYQYDGGVNEFLLCDLQSDPDEKKCQVVSGDKENNLTLIKKLLSDTY